MFRELSGDGVKKEIDAYIRESVKSFAAEGIVPKLAVIRAGDDDGQKYYENAILRQSNAYGIETQAINFTSNIGQTLIEVTLQAVNEDESVHGIILLRPLPDGINSEKLRTMLNPVKDVDAITDISIAELFAGKDDAFFACTAEEMGADELAAYAGADAMLPKQEARARPSAIFFMFIKKSPFLSNRFLYSSRRKTLFQGENKD